MRFTKKDFAQLHDHRYINVRIENIATQDSHLDYFSAEHIS